MEIVRQTCPQMSQLNVLVVGAGDMAQHACRYLAEAGVAKLVITSRTFNNARTLAEACGGIAAPYAELDQLLASADVVITATSCPTPILTEQRVARAVQHTAQQRLLLIDLSVPRNIESAAGHLPGVKLYDIDSLSNLAERNHRTRSAAARQCEAIIEEEVRIFQRWIADTRVGPLIGRMFRDVRELANIEVRQLFNRCPDLSADQKEEVAQLVDRLVGKLLHPCVSAIRERAASATSNGIEEELDEQRLIFQEAF
jgi:glutamyl-tRNA reductase